MSKQPPQVQFNFEPDTIEPSKADDLIDEIIEDVIDEQEPSVKLPDVEKQVIKTEDVFEYPDNLAVLPDKVRKDIEAEFMEQGEVFKETKPKPRKQTLNKNGKPRKQLSEEHKQKLKVAREKALEVRRQKAAERKKEKAFQEEEKALQRKKKQQDFDKLKKEVEQPDKIEPSKEPAPIQRSSETWVTKADLEKAQFDAIAKYEILRKQRKAEKRQKEQIEQEKQNIINKLKPQNTGYRAMGNNGRYLNPYDSCY